jgi:hypothetical protein
MGLLVMAIGALAVTTAVLIAAGSAELAGLLNVIVGIVFVVWTPWLGGIG